MRASGLDPQRRILWGKRIHDRWLLGVCRSALEGNLCPVSVLYLSEAEVDQLIEMPAALEVVEEAFVQLSAGKATNVPRNRARAPGIVLHSMSAAAEYLGRAGWKQYTTTRSGARFLVGLYAASGELEALIEADRLGQYRTGAVTGVAIRALTDPAADTLGLIGSGLQAQTQLEAAAAVRTLRRVRVFSRSRARREQFAQTNAARLGIEIEPVASAAAAAAGSSIVVTITNAKQPVLENESVGGGTLICAAGANDLDRTEIAPELIARIDAIVCDSVAACRQEAGELAEWLKYPEKSPPLELADLVAGSKSLCATGETTVLFKSVGLAIEDLALAARVVDRARALGCGCLLPVAAGRTSGGSVAEREETPGPPRVD